MQLLKKLRIKIHGMNAASRRRKIKKPFTIIASNCFAGLTCKYLGAEFTTPTVGTYIFPAEYLKFIGNLKYYLSLDLRFIDMTESKYRKILEQRDGANLVIGVLDDVEIVFLHYPTREEAEKKWNRRKARVCYDNLIFHFNDQNFATTEQVRQFAESDIPKKMCFVAKEHMVDSPIVYCIEKKNSFVRSDYYKFKKYVDIIALINK